MYKKSILTILTVALLSNVCSASENNKQETMPNKQTELRKLNLEKEKTDLKKMIDKAVKDCDCLISKVSSYQNSFPLNDKNQQTSAEDYNSSKIMTQYIYNQTLTNLKKTTSNSKDEANKIIDDWSSKDNSPEKIKELEVKVSEKLRAFLSFCTAPVNQIETGIYKYTSKVFGLGGKKINAQKQCNIKTN